MASLLVNHQARIDIVLLIMMTWMQIAFTRQIPNQNLANTFSLIIPLVHRDNIPTSYTNPSLFLSDYPDPRKCGYLDTMCIDYIVSSIVASKDFGLFYVKFRVGDGPSFEQYAVMDTGSQLNWIECEPNANHHTTPIYNLHQTTSFKNLSCKVHDCFIVGGECNVDKSCKFNQTYTGGIYSIGVIGKDVLSFENDMSFQISVPNVVLGCSYDNKPLKGLMSGVVGLGGTEPSLAGWFGWRFSYCVGSVYDLSNTYSHLALGIGARFKGQSTPMEVDRKYYVNLLGISLGGNLLDIPYDQTFKKDDSQKRGVFVDSGGELTKLVSVAYEQLFDTVSAMFPRLYHHRARTGRLCMQGTRDIYASNFPSLTFHFSGGATLVMGWTSLFHQYHPEIFCMTIEPSKNNMSIIGMSSQQGYNVGFDVPSKLIYFEKINCESISNVYI